MAALTANAIIISQNRASFPLPKLQTQTHLSKFATKTSISSFFSSASASPPRTHLSEAEVQTSAMSTSWSEFAKNISGEWDGHGADFTVQGNPIELPENVVPEAYREWEVRVFDWQTQCPTLADPDEPSLMYKSIKLLPTVGCEADAATRYTIDERNIGGDDENGVLGFGYQSSGCYVAVWPIEHLGRKKLELEHCLINPGDKESRVRVVQIVGVDGSKMVLEGVRVFREQWYGPFRNGDQLGGCAIRDAAFATTGTMEASEVVGNWQGIAAVASFLDSPTNFEEVVDAGMRKLVRDESDLMLLPKQLWCSLKESGNGETCSEVGWLLEHGRAITSRCFFSDTTKLKEVSVLRESAALEGV